MKRSKRGFTLVEMLVSIAILSVLCVAASGFLLTGSRVYSSINYTVRLQYEAQLAMAQLQEYVMDCDAGVVWDGTAHTLYLADREAGGTTLAMFRFDPADQCIYFSSAAASASPAAASDLMAEHVTGMTVSLAGTAAGTVEAASIELKMEHGGKAYTGTETVALRNCPATAGDWETLFNGLSG